MQRQPKRGIKTLIFLLCNLLQLTRQEFYPCDLPE